MLRLAADTVTVTRETDVRGNSEMDASTQMYVHSITTPTIAMTDVEKAT